MWTIASLIFPAHRGIRLLPATIGPHRLGGSRLNRQRAVPAGEPIRDLGPECQECLRIARLYDDAAAVGNRYNGGELALNDVPAPELTGGRAVVNFAVRREAVTLTDSSGEVLDELAVGLNVFSGANLVWSDSEQTWLVESFNIG
jgi:hypothetical protein